jgi:hypothetical protein
MFRLSCVNRPRNQPKELFEILSLKQPVAIGWIPVHWNLAVSSPGSNRSLGHSQDFGRFCNFHVFAEFGHNPPPDRLEFDVGRKFIKHYSEMTALQMP